MNIIFSNESFLIESQDDFITFKFHKKKFDKSFSNFLKQYPDYKVSAIKLGSDAISAYKSNKNLTTRFFAKNKFERDIYNNITDILNKSGKFKLITKRIQNGGMYYEMVKK